MLQYFVFSLYLSMYGVCNFATTNNVLKDSNICQSSIVPIHETMISSAHEVHEAEKTADDPPTCATDPTGTNDADGDGIRDDCDSDDDNDGITDCIEKGLANVDFIDLFDIAGDAVQISSTEIQLTQAIDDRAGSSFTLDRIDFSKDFFFTFEVNLGSQDNGADGIAMVFHNDPAGSKAVGADGEGLGAKGIQNGIVLELDTYDNGNGLGDLPTDHGSIWDSNNQGGVGLLTTAVSVGNIEDNIWRRVRVFWDAGTQTISYSLNTVVLGSFTNNLVANYFGGSSLVYFGFTASTGGANNDQRIRFPNGFCGFPLFVDFDNDGIENHLDLDSDNDGCPDFIEGGANFQTTDGMLATGTVSDGNGGIVMNNLGNTVGTVFGVDLGVPTIAGSGQPIGDSQDTTEISVCCDYSVYFKLRNVSCDSTGNGSATAVSNGGVPPFSYRWDAGTGNQTTATVNNLSIGDYGVTLTDRNGCQSRAGVIIEELDCPPPCSTNPCVDAIVNNTDICLVLTNDPSDPLGPLDCDGDGVTNVTECSDGTNPLDPCDFVGTSITLPVTADQTNCAIPCPDLSPTVTVLPGNIAGQSLVEVAIKLTELNGVDTDGTVVTVRVPSDPRLVFVWSIGLTQVALTSVQNSEWNYLGDNGIFHTWTYNGPGLVIPSNGVTAFGFQSFYDPQATDGQTTLTATIVPYSGAECNILNNTDSERLVYFK